MERQEEEAKAQRREAARRRTRDLLLERAKQRLLAVAAAAAGVAGANSATTTGIGRLLALSDVSNTPNLTFIGIYYIAAVSSTNTWHTSTEFPTCPEP